MAASKLENHPRPRKRHYSWSDPGVRAVVYQGMALGIVAIVAWMLVSNTLHNLSVRNIATGFGFLGKEAGFAIGESVIPYEASQSYGRAVLVGLLNTLRVAAVGIILATLLGTLIGIARLSGNRLLSGLCAAYIEVARNVPLLIQLFFWYALVTETAPGPRQALHIVPGVFLSNRGLTVPALDGAWATPVLSGLLCAVLACWALVRYGRAYQGRTGRRLPVLWLGALLLAGMPALFFAASGTQVSLSVPYLGGFNFTGGMTVSPEFFALLMGLVTYTAAFIAEIVRSGIQAVKQGQWEAADSLGLPRGRTLRLVVLPQALRVMIPPLTSQYLNLTKNSSLAVAIGYPDIVSIVNTTLNQTGQAIEGVLIIMAAYLTVSLSISMAMNWYNQRLAARER